MRWTSAQVLVLFYVTRLTRPQETKSAVPIVSNNATINAPEVAESRLSPVLAGAEEASAPTPKVVRHLASKFLSKERLLKGLKIPNWLKISGDKKMGDNSRPGNLVVVKQVLGRKPDSPHTERSLDMGGGFGSLFPYGSSDFGSNGILTTTGTPNSLDHLYLPEMSLKEYGKPMEINDVDVRGLPAEISAAPTSHSATFRGNPGNQYNSHRIHPNDIGYGGFSDMGRPHPPGHKSSSSFHPPSSHSSRPPLPPRPRPRPSENNPNMNNKRHGGEGDEGGDDSRPSPPGVDDVEDGGIRQIMELAQMMNSNGFAQLQGMQSSGLDFGGGGGGGGDGPPHEGVRGGGGGGRGGGSSSSEEQGGHYGGEKRPFGLEESGERGSGGPPRGGRYHNDFPTDDNEGYENGDRFEGKRPQGQRGQGRPRVPSSSVFGKGGKHHGNHQSNSGGFGGNKGGSQEPGVGGDRGPPPFGFGGGGPRPGPEQHPDMSHLNGKDGQSFQRPDDSYDFSSDDEEGEDGGGEGGFESPHSSFGGGGRGSSSSSGGGRGGGRGGGYGNNQSNRDYQNYDSYGDDEGGAEGFDSPKNYRDHQPHFPSAFDNQSFEDSQEESFLDDSPTKLSSYDAGNNKHGVGNSGNSQPSLFQNIPNGFGEFLAL